MSKFKFRSLTDKQELSSEKLGHHVIKQFEGDMFTVTPTGSIWTDVPFLVFLSSTLMLISLTFWSLLKFFPPQDKAILVSLLTLSLAFFTASFAYKSWSRFSIVFDGKNKLFGYRNASTKNPIHSGKGKILGLEVTSFRDKHITRYVLSIVYRMGHQKIWQFDSLNSAELLQVKLCSLLNVPEELPEALKYENSIESKLLLYLQVILLITMLLTICLKVIT